MSSRKYPEKAINCVYKISFKDTKWFYIGSTTNSQERIWKHTTTLRLNKHKNKIFQNCFNKYGEEALLIEILEKDLASNLREREQYWINTLQPTINLAKDVRGHFGMKVSEQAKEAISIKIKALHASGFYKSCPTYAKNYKPYKRSAESQGKIVKKYYEWCNKHYKKRDEKLMELSKIPLITQAEICRKLNISATAVRNFLKKNNIILTNGKNKKKK